IDHVNISHNSSNYGGGMYCRQNSNPVLRNVIISNNTGRGIFCLIDSNPVITNSVISNNSGSGLALQSNSNPILNNVLIKENETNQGGGININSSSPSLFNVQIINNIAFQKGGGIFAAYPTSIPMLSNVLTVGNKANQGGGIYLSGASIAFDPDNLSNIYSNRGTIGKDLYTTEFVTVTLDTFTVANPTEFHAYPPYFFEFDIQNGLHDQISQDVYVSPEGDDSGSGLSLSDPFQTINHALTVLLAEYDDTRTIFLSPGIYSQETNNEYFPITLVNNIMLSGCGEEETILDADYSDRVIYFWEVYQGSIDNMTIRRGDGGVYCYQSDPVMSNLIITENTVTPNQSTGNFDGGGIELSVSSPLIQNVVVSGNQARNGGGIKSIMYSDPILHDIILTDNSATNGGGLYFSIHSNPQTIGLEITNNTADLDGGGIYCDFSDPGFEKLIITGNTANQFGGGIFCAASNPVFVNATISDNTSGEHGNGFYCLINSHPALVNTVLHNDQLDEVYFLENYTSSSISISYSDIPSGVESILTNGNGTILWGTTNISVDPLFSDPSNGDYSLLPESPCIDAGNPGSPLDPDGTISDMGAIYFDQSVECPIYGDLNQDEIVNISDIIITLACILYEEDCSCSDMDLSGDINVVDILQMVDIILE
ncbi:MAG: right-handed parallel beta-helix repeat-containing protein, partial [Fidelibacterota bacterium]